MLEPDNFILAGILYLRLENLIEKRVDPQSSMSNSSMADMWHLSKIVKLVVIYIKRLSAYFMRELEMRNYLGMVS